MPKDNLSGLDAFIVAVDELRDCLLDVRSAYVAGEPNKDVFFYRAKKAAVDMVVKSSPLFENIVDGLRRVR
jgi:hypothetical protein